MTRNAPISWGLIRSTARYYWGQRRIVAGLRALFWTIVWRHGYELCQECGGRYHDVIWHAPQPLWDELVGSQSGLLCPSCFERKARAEDIRLTWTPIVQSRHGVETTNWWHDPTRDRLLMGEPDPLYLDAGLVRVPQGPWGTVAAALGWSDRPYYPPENCVQPEANP